MFSLFGTVLDLSVCIYRLGSGLWLSKRVSNKEELKDLGMRLKASRHFGLENLLSMFMRIIGDKSLGNRLSDMESLINHENDVRILALFKENIVNSVDHRVKEIEKQIEQDKINYLVWQCGVAIKELQSAVDELYKSKEAS